MGDHSPLTEAELAELEALDRAGIAAPWGWFGNANAHEIYLATTDRGRVYVMAFDRWGMSGGQPVFQTDRDGIGVMVPAKTALQFEVPYRKDIVGIDHPDARLIPAARNALPRLLAEVRRLRAEVALLASHPAPSPRSETESPPKLIERNTSTEEGRAFWASAEQAAAEVESWPDWKRAGINEAESRARARSEAERTRTPVCYCGDVLRDRACPFCSPEAYYGPGWAPVPAESAKRAPPISEAARRARDPLPPHVLVAALEERIAPVPGRVIATKPLPAESATKGET